MLDRNREPGKPLVIAITGGIACGKSEVARCFHDWGATVIEADELAHRALVAGTPTYREVVNTFGEEIVMPDGAIDRKLLGRKILANPEERRRLEQIVHPPVISHILRWAEQIRTSNAIGAAVVPLLFEVGLVGLWDAIVCVISPLDHVLARLEARGWSREEAWLWLEAQLPMEEKAKRSDFVLNNNGSLAELREQARAVWNEIMKKECVYNE